MKKVLLIMIKYIPIIQMVGMLLLNTIDDSYASDETTFRRWVATMIGNGIPID